MTPYPRPDNAADARGLALRKKTRSALLGVEADARGLALRKKTRSALLGVEDGCPRPRAAEENPLRPYLA